MLLNLVSLTMELEVVRQPCLLPMQNLEAIARLFPFC